MKVGFALLSNSRDPAPSTWIACLNLFAHLRAAGFEPEILFEPVAASESPEVGNLSVIARYSLETQAQLFIGVLKKLAAPQAASPSLAYP